MQDCREYIVIYECGYDSNLFHAVSVRILSYVGTASLSALNKFLILEKLKCMTYCLPAYTVLSCKFMFCRQASPAFRRNSYNILPQEVRKILVFRCHGDSLQYNDDNAIYLYFYMKTIWLIVQLLLWLYFYCIFNLYAINNNLKIILEIRYISKMLLRTLIHTEFINMY